MRDSPSLILIPKLLDEGCHICAYDPEGLESAKKIFNDNRISWFTETYSAMVDSDILVILTEWNQFRALDFKKVKSLLKTPILVDFRNIYDPKEMREKGFNYFSIGRPKELFL